MQVLFNTIDYVICKIINPDKKCFVKQNLLHFLKILGDG